MSRRKSMCAMGPNLQGLVMGTFLNWVSQSCWLTIQNLKIKSNFSDSSTVHRGARITVFWPDDGRYNSGTASRLNSDGSLALNCHDRRKREVFHSRRDLACQRFWPEYCCISWTDNDSTDLLCSEVRIRQTQSDIFKLMLGYFGNIFL